MSLFWTHDPTECFLPEGPFETAQEAAALCRQLIDCPDFKRAKCSMFVMKGEQLVPAGNNQPGWTTFCEVEA